MRLTMDGVIAHDDRVAARYRLAGVQARDFYGPTVTGRATEAEGIAWLRFADGRVVEEWQVRIAASAENNRTSGTLTRLAARASAAREPGHSAAADAAALN